MEQLHVVYLVNRIIILNYFWVLTAVEETILSLVLGN